MLSDFTYKTYIYIYVLPGKIKNNYVFNFIIFINLCYN